MTDAKELACGMESMMQHAENPRDVATECLAVTVTDDDDEPYQTRSYFFFRACSLFSPENSYTISDLAVLMTERHITQHRIFPGFRRAVSRGRASATGECICGLRHYAWALAAPSLNNSTFSRGDWG